MNTFGEKSKINCFQQSLTVHKTKEFRFGNASGEVGPTDFPLFCVRQKTIVQSTIFGQTGKSAKPSDFLFDSIFSLKWRKTKKRKSLPPINGDA
jgi:hypothetical protein